MDTILLVVILVLVLLICVILWRNNDSRIHGKNSRVSVHKESVSELIAATDLSCDEDTSENLSIRLEQIDDLTDLEKESLFEIVDEETKQRVLQIVPEAAQILQNVGMANVANSTECLYQAIIPAGVSLDKSRHLAGAVRGTYRKAGKIFGQAEFVENLSGKRIAVQGTVNAAIGVGALIVGQYYMSCINKAMNKINDRIQIVSQFLADEFRSKVIVLGIEIQQMSKYQLEIYDKPEVRYQEICHLRSLGHECAQLLEQANLPIERISSKELSQNEQKEYEKRVREAALWYDYQKVLQELICRISEMIFTLYQGEVSVDYCRDFYKPYYLHAEEVRTNLEKWQKSSAEICKVDCKNKRIERVGILGAFGRFIPAAKYKKIGEDTLEAINRVNDNSKVILHSNLFTQDTKIVIHANKMYYLPTNNTETGMN